MTNQSKNPLSLIFYRLKTLDALKAFLEHRYFQNTILGLIILNAITIGMETSPEILEIFGEGLHQLDKFILIIFTIEISLKVVAYRHRFFMNAWNVFDFLIVAIALVPAAGPLHILRTLRILRTARLIKNVPRLKMIMESLIKSIPSIGWIAVLLFIIFYIFAVIGTDLYQAKFPEYFGDMGTTFFTLFQVMTLESWSSGIARPMMEQVPMAYVFFVPFILLATYTTLNVFIAIVVNTMNEINRAEMKEEEERVKDFMHTEHQEMLDYLSSISNKISDLEKKIDQKDKS
ncbi:MAG: voltage-gated sodium channel [Cyclobacteriaceae bacterium]|jgi:voltage-gated sodium channel